MNENNPIIHKGAIRFLPDLEGVKTTDYFRVLICEDQQLDAELIQRALMLFEGLLGQPEIIITNTFSAALSIVKALPTADIVILDPSLDDHSLEETIRDVNQIDDYCPTFILTGYLKSEVEKMLMEANAEHVQVVEKKAEVYQQGFLRNLISNVIGKWHSRRNKAVRESLRILENYQRA